MTRSVLLRATLLIAAISGMSFDRRAEAQTTGFQYAVKFIIGRSSGEVAAKGTYFTAINVHNPSTDTTFSKRFVIAKPKEDPTGAISPSTKVSFPKDRALEIDPGDIWTHTQTPVNSFLKGFAIIESTVELDVVAVYTVANDAGQVEALHMERVPPRRH